MTAKKVADKKGQAVKKNAIVKKTEDKAGAPAGGKTNVALKPATAVNVRHILCEKHSRALEALRLISEEHQPFDKVAQEYSEDKAKAGGSLGWMIRGSMVEPFQSEAFKLAPSSCSKPIISPLTKTKFGYHIVMVEGRR